MMSNIAFVGEPPARHHSHTHQPRHGAIQRQRCVVDCDGTLGGST